MHWKTYIEWATTRSDNPLTPQFAAECAAAERDIVDYDTALEYALSL